MGDIGELQATIHVQQDFYAINSVLHISLKNDDHIYAITVRKNPIYNKANWSFFFK
jgi:hypothetical protein